MLPSTLYLFRLDCVITFFATHHPLMIDLFPIGKYTALLAILIVGSFVVPMAQYWWYVKDDDSTDRFFGQQKTMAPPEPPKKKGWF